MAIVGANLGGEGLTATQATYTFPAAGTWTPVSGEFCLAACLIRKGTAADTPTTFVGTGGFLVTWTLVDTLATGGNTLNKIALYRGVPSSGTAGTIVVGFGVTNQLQCAVQVTSFSGVDQTTNQGVVQSANDSGSTGGTLLATFGGLTAGNGTYLAGVARGTPTSYTLESPVGWTAYSVLGGIGALASQWAAGNDLTPSGDFDPGTNWAAIGVEIAATAAAGLSIPVALRQYRQRGA